MEHLLPYSNAVCAKYGARRRVSGHSGCAGNPIRTVHRVPAGCPGKVSGKVSDIIPGKVSGIILSKVSGIIPGKKRNKK